MKYLSYIISLAILTSCGYTSVNNSMTGQPKRLFYQTPLFCSNRTDLDISLGVMKNGTGSVSKEDLFLTVQHESDVVLLDSAIKNGQIVTIEYSELRFRICSNSAVVTKVTIEK